MGHPKFPRKRYDTPLHPWKEERIKSEKELIKKYGLKNHKEVWKAKTYLGRYRQHARELLGRIGSQDPQVKKESDDLLLHLTRVGMLPEGSSLDDVLALETESVLGRRLQTLVYLRGLSSTIGHSRQLINHGHIAIGNRKVTIPGYIVRKDEENEIRYTNGSPLNELSHPARPKTDVYRTTVFEKERSEPETEVVELIKKPEGKKEPVEGAAESAAPTQKPIPENRQSEEKDPNIGEE
jgi:small subunit ribosomal protein S4